MKILVVEDQPIYRKGLVRVIKTHKEVTLCHEAENGFEAIEKHKAQSYDIVFMDISMPVMDGVEATRILKKDYPGIQIIILSMYDSLLQVTELLNLDISAYLMKNAGEREILKALTLVCEGSFYFTPTISQIWNQYIKEKAWKQAYKPEIKLSTMEKKVLKNICEENSSKEISEKMNLAISTINNHKQNIMKKLNIHTNVGLAMYAIRNRIIE